MNPGDEVAGRYSLRRKLGTGGMGEVWLALHCLTDREVALKLLHPHVAESAEMRARFMREARASAKINHPNIVDVLDAGEVEDGRLFLAMEMLDGMPLAEALQATPPLVLRDFLVIIADVCRALGAAHAAGIVHRDIKPQNIFLHRDRATGVAHGKVLDFGISKFEAMGDGVATTTGALLGSPHYMSPEQTRALPGIDGRTDIWAVGVLLFHALTGTWPHVGDSLTALCVAITTMAPASIDEHAPHAPEPLRAIIRGCLSPREYRFNDASALAEQIESLALDPVMAQHQVSANLTDPSGQISSKSIQVRTPSSMRTPLPQSLELPASTPAPQHLQPVPSEPSQPGGPHSGTVQLGESPMPGTLASPEGPPIGIESSSLAQMSPVASAPAVPGRTSMLPRLLGVVIVSSIIGAAVVFGFLRVSGQSDDTAGAPAATDTAEPGTVDSAPSAAAEATDESLSAIESSGDDDLTAARATATAAGSAEADAGAGKASAAKPRQPRPTRPSRPRATSGTPQGDSKVPAGVVGEDLGSGL